MDEITEAITAMKRLIQRLESSGLDKRLICRRAWFLTSNLESFRDWVRDNSFGQPFPAHQQQSDSVPVLADSED